MVPQLLYNKTVFNMALWPWKSQAGIDVKVSYLYTDFEINELAVVTGSYQVSECPPISVTCCCPCSVALFSNALLVVEGQQMATLCVYRYKAVGCLISSIRLLLCMHMPNIW